MRIKLSLHNYHLYRIRNERFRFFFFFFFGYSDFLVIRTYIYMYKLTEPNKIKNSFDILRKTLKFLETGVFVRLLLMLTRFKSS